MRQIIARTKLLGGSAPRRLERRREVISVTIDLVPMLLGAGIRLFDHLGGEPVELERTSIIEAPGVTHLRFRVVK